jgi:molybdopterin synthase catalytic subunit
MKTTVEITRDPLEGEVEPTVEAGSGAVVVFSGVVRPEENGQPLAALDYEAYEPMARDEMRRILADLSVRFPCDSVRVRHRLGRVGAGEASIVVRVAARHRAEAFGLLAAFMDRLKKDVPIWKRASP